MRHAADAGRPPRPRANALLLAVAALPFLLGNQGAVCGTGIPATVIERIVRDAAAPEVAAAMPYAYRYRIRTDAPIALVGSDVFTVDAVDDLAVGSRWGFALSLTIVDDMTVYRTRPVGVGECGIQPLPTPTPARGCAHCDAGGPASLVVALAALALVARRRRV